MRKILVLLCVMIVSVPMLAGCNKLSGDNSLLALLGLGSGTPVAGTFAKDVYGTGIGPSSTNILFNSTTSEGRFMVLGLTSDIKGAGYIDSISFKFVGYNANEVACPGVIIKMGHTNVTSLGTTYLDNVEVGRGSFETVFSGTVTIPVGSSGTFFTIPLDTPFHYNGVDNLVIEIVRTTAATNDVEISAPQHSSGDIFMVFGTGAGASTASSGMGTSQFPYLRLNFTGGDNKLVYGTAANALPFWTDEDYRRVQMLYPASSINGSGGITGIGFAIGTTTTEENEFTISVQLGHTTKTGLETASWEGNFDSGSPITVASNAVFRVPANVTAGEYLWLPLAKAFDYNGTDNLIVDINVTSATSMVFLQIDNSGVDTRLEGSGDVPALSGNARYNVKFRFKGGSADVITAGTDQINMPFTHVFDSQVQFVYRAAELGVQGDISRVGFRMYGDSTADTYHNFHVVMGHTDKTALSTLDTFASNLDDATTVYDGAVLIPAGLKGGDWFSIPLSHSFTYNPLKNLVVYLITDMGASGTVNPIHGETSATRYGSRFAYATDTTSTSPAAGEDILSTIRFVMK